MFFICQILSFNTLCNIKYYKEYYAMKYVKTFNESSEYENFLNSSEYMIPNISYVRNSNYVHFSIPLNSGGGDIPSEPSITAGVGDIVYWDGSSVKTCTIDTWNTSLGTPIGVVVVPSGFAPDGKIRLIGLKPVDSNGNQSDSNVKMIWGPEGTDTSLTNYNRVPTTDNAGSTSTGSEFKGNLPSDMFTGAQSYVDPEAYYNSSYTSSLIPSPYLGDKPNTEYYKEISGYNNALSDFNGLSNTQTLVGLGSDYEAANAAWKYKDGVSTLQWYLPAMGELGYIPPRFNLINVSLTAVGGVAVSGNLTFWSSSEYSSGYAYYSGMDYGSVNNYFKDMRCYVRPFCTL